MAMRLLPFSWLDFSMDFDESKSYNYRVVPVLGGKAKSAFVKITRLRTMDASKMSEEWLWWSVELERTSVFQDRIKHMYMKM